VSDQDLLLVQMQIVIEDNMELIEIRLGPELIDHHYLDQIDHHYLDLIITPLVTLKPLRLRILDFQVDQISTHLEILEAHITLDPPILVELPVEQIITPLVTQATLTTLNLTQLAERQVDQILMPPETREVPTILEPLMLVGLDIMAPQVMEIVAIMMRIHIIHETAQVPMDLKLMK